MAKWQGLNHSKQQEATETTSQQWDLSLINYNKYLRRTIIISLFKDFYVSNYLVLRYHNQYHR